MAIELQRNFVCLENFKLTALVKFYYVGMAVKTKSMIIIINAMTNLNLKFKLLASKRALLRPIKILQCPDKLIAGAVN
jgi:hypothetical protein